MSDAQSGLQREYRQVIVEVLTEHDPSLLASLQSHAVPTMAQRLQVLQIVSAEFCRHLRPDSEPTERGVLIDDALGKFLLAWPIERE